MIAALASLSVLSIGVTFLLLRWTQHGAMKGKVAAEVLLIDKHRWFGTDVHPLGGRRMLGAVLMVAGIGLIAKF